MIVATAFKNLPSNQKVIVFLSDPTDNYAQAELLSPPENSRRWSAYNFSMQEVIMIVLRVVAVCFVSCIMLASAEVNAQDKADQLRSIERARLRALVDADIPTASPAR